MRLYGSLSRVSVVYFSLTAAPPVMSKLRMSSVHVSSDVLLNYVTIDGVVVICCANDIYK